MSLFLEARGLGKHAVFLPFSCHDVADDINVKAGVEGGTVV